MEGGAPKNIIRRASAMDDKPDLSSAASAKEEGRQLFGERALPAVSCRRRPAVGTDHARNGYMLTR